MKQQMNWKACVMACQTTRHRLFVNDHETPYFLDHARTVAHFTQGRPIGLYGSGMGVLIRHHNGSSYRIAAVLDSFRSLREAKRRAESLALNLNTVASNTATN